MAITLPTPLRVAAGIVASGIELVRSLPEELPALPVTLVGKAMQLSMKVQQEIADLATKGDELLSGVLGGPQENPPWAQFDDEPPTSAVSAVSPPPRPAGAVPSGAGSARAGAARAATTPRTAPSATTRVAEGGKAPVVTPLARSTRLDTPDPDAPVRDDSTPAAAEPPADKATTDKATTDKATADNAAEKAKKATDMGLVHPPAADADTDTETAEPPPNADPAVTADAGSANGEAPPSSEGEAEEPDDGPDALPDYDRMTLAQVRGYLRSLSAGEVQSLLEHEQSGENRAPFLTLLSNRLVTLEHQES